MSHIATHRDLLMNGNGGMYVNGQSYSLKTKQTVIQTYMRLHLQNPARIPTMVEVAVECQVSHGYVHKVLHELRETGCLQDPSFIRARESASRRQVAAKLDAEASIFLLALRVEDDRRPLHVYAEILRNELQVNVSHQTIDTFFKKRYQYRGSLRKSNFVPLDKFRNRNIARYIEFVDTLEQLPDHRKYHFIDEKHVVNSDCLPNKVRADPLSGRIRNIPVTGNFRDAFNLIAVISANPDKEFPIYWAIGPQNGNAASYTAFLEHLIARRWFNRGDVLIRDRASIHDKKEAKIAADVLWTFPLDGVPLNVLTVPLPARSPELNPIELVFHILARRLRSYKYRCNRPKDVTVPQQVGRVLYELNTETVLKCCRTASAICNLVYK